MRSWYDPQYSDPAWIGQCGARCNGPALTVIPRHHAWIRRYAPSLTLQLAFSEWAFGFNDSSEVGALSTCESLAVLGAYNATWGLRWVSPEPGTLTEEVWRLWFDYDGASGTLHGEFAATASAMAPNVTAYTTWDRATGRLHLLLFSHLEHAIDCSAGDDSALTVPAGATSATSAATYALVPGAWKVTKGAALDVASSGGVTVKDAACGMPGRSVRLVVVEGVKVTSQEHAVWRPWEGKEYDGVDWDHPFSGLSEEQMRRLAEHERGKALKVREGKRLQRERHHTAALRAVAQSE